MTQPVVLSYGMSQLQCPELKTCRIGLSIYDEQTNRIFDDLNHCKGSGIHEATFDLCPIGYKHPCSSVNVVIHSIKQEVVSE